MVPTNVEGNPVWRVRIINFNLRKTELKLGLVFGTCSERGTDFLFFKRETKPRTRLPSKIRLLGEKKMTSK
jgi:hypothetical protein